MNQRIIVSTEARRSILAIIVTPAEIKDAQAIMRAAMAQPHRLGGFSIPRGCVDGHGSRPLLSQALAR